jgi:DNA-binding NarL/FixJ family response regulator
MDRTPGIADAPFLVNLLARLKRALCPLPRHNALRLVVLTNGAHTTTTTMIAAFHENWAIRFAVSPGDAMALLRKAPTAALVYDWDLHEGDWRELCSACVQCGIPFHLVANMPSDDLFLAVASAGGSGVLWKPLSADQVIAAIGSARSLVDQSWTMDTTRRWALPSDPRDGAPPVAAADRRSPVRYRKRLNLG